jgi:ABC-type glycerol-3-phosphate transport system permease component
MSSAEVLEQTRPKPKRRRKPKWQRMGIMGYVALGLVTFLSLFPFYWMFIVASNGTDEISKIPPTLVPGPRFFTVVS